MVNHLAGREALDDRVVSKFHREKEGKESSNVELPG